MEKALFVYLILQAVSNLNFCNSMKMAELITRFFTKQKNFVNQLFTSSGDLKNWSLIERKFELNDNYITDGFR